MLRKIAIIITIGIAIIAGGVFCAAGLLTLLELTCRAHSAPSCMSKAEARHAFETSHIYWHGVSHCWDATSPRSRHVTRHAPSRDDMHDRHAASRAVTPIPEVDQRKLVLAVPEPEPATPWSARWPDIVQVGPGPKHVAVHKPDPMVTPRDVVAVVLVVFLSIALAEVIFDRSRRPKLDSL